MPVTVLTTDAEKTADDAVLGMSLEGSAETGVLIGGTDADTDRGACAET